MEPFTMLDAAAVPLDLPNVDTDQLVPARFLRLPRAQQAEIMFHDLRFNAQGERRPEFVLNQPSYEGAKILVADRNFGCGSSRECAVTVLLDNGFRAVVAPSFGDIFFNNCFQNGVLPVRLPAERVTELRELLHASPGVRISIDLASQSILGPDGKSDHFQVDSFRKDCLLKGVDEIKLTLGYESSIRAFEERQRETMAWLD